MLDKPTERLTAEALREIRERHPASMHATDLDFRTPAKIIRCLLAHVAALEAELQEAREQWANAVIPNPCSSLNPEAIMKMHDSAIRDLFRVQLVAAVRDMLDIDDEALSRIVKLIESFEVGR